MVYVATIINEQANGVIEYSRLGNVYRAFSKAKSAFYKTVELYIDLHGCVEVEREETNNRLYSCVTNGRDAYHIEVVPRELI